MKKRPESGLHRCNVANAQSCAPTGAQLFVPQENVVLIDSRISLVLALEYDEMESRGWDLV